MGTLSFRARCALLLAVTLLLALTGAWIGAEAAPEDMLLVSGTPG